MRSSERRRFARLKSEIVRRVQEQFPEVPADITAWRKKEIGLFQKALSQEIKSQVSEKWFYTHMKSHHSSLPRIDMLDMLSQFVGHDSWDQFNRQHNRRTVTWRPLFFVTIPLLVAVTWWGFYPSCSKFCFVNLYGRQPIDGQEVNVYLLQEGESPLLLGLDEEACVCVDDMNAGAQLMISSAYFVNDTIVRKSRKGETEQVALRPDDYAQLISMFANSDVANWQSYRSNLMDMFMANARIYELKSNGSRPVALYNREEFVNKLTMPIDQGRPLEIVDITYEKNKISILRYIRK